MAQRNQQMQMVKKLNRIEQELESFKKEVLGKIEKLESESYYPAESRIRKSYIKKIAKIDKEMKKGLANTYKSVKEMDAVIRSRI